MIFTNKQQGQTTIEYLLVLAVVGFLLTMVYRSNMFKKFFGRDSQVFGDFRKAIEHNYRHGFQGISAQVKSRNVRYSKVHESYFNKGKSRFFFTRKYPDN